MHSKHSNSMPYDREHCAHANTLKHLMLLQKLFKKNQNLEIQSECYHGIIPLNGNTLNILFATNLGNHTWSS